MNVTEHLNQFIAENGGNARDALNVALARLARAEETIGALQGAFDYVDCANCNGIIAVGSICLDCGYDPSVD